MQTGRRSCHLEKDFSGHIESGHLVRMPWDHPNGNDRAQQRTKIRLISKMSRLFGVSPAGIVTITQKLGNRVRTSDSEGIAGTRKLCGTPHSAGPKGCMESVSSTLYLPRGRGVTTRPSRRWRFVPGPSDIRLPPE